MKTVTKSQAAAPQATRARFLEVRAGRLRSDEPASPYSERLALDRRTVGPTD